MKATELRQKTIEEIKQISAKIKTDLQAMSIDFIKGKEKSNQKVRKLRKDFARALTVLNEKFFLGNK